VNETEADLISRDPEQPGNEAPADQDVEAPAEDMTEARQDEPVRDAAEAVLDRMHSDADRIRRLAHALVRGGAAGVMLIHLSATASVSWIVFSNPFAWPLMHVSMGLLLALLLGIRLAAVIGNRRGAAIRAFVTNLVMHAFWIFVLLDQIPGRVVFQRTLVQRPDLPILWVPVVLYVLAMIGMIGQGVVSRRAHATL
jgi:hypothetical protein